MAYNYDAHQIIKKYAANEDIEPADQAILDLHLAEEEQIVAIETYVSLAQEKDLQGLLECSGFNEACFAQRFALDKPTIRRWKAEGMTEFDREMMIYLLCQAENESDRLHSCPTCGKMFLAYMPKEGLCADCRAELLAKTDSFLRSWKTY